MSQAEMERELSAVTGESISTIRRRGFQYVETSDLQPLVVDWDALAEERVSVMPQRNRIRRAA